MPGAHAILRTGAYRVNLCVGTAMFGMFPVAAPAAHATVARAPLHAPKDPVPGIDGRVRAGR